MNPNPESVKDHYEVCAGKIAEAQTRQIAREFKTSKPKPRNRAMGFTGRDPARIFYKWSKND